MMIVTDHAYAQQPIRYDEGLQFGRGVFETLRVGAKPQFLHEHLARLSRGLAALGLQKTIDERKIGDLIALYGIKHCVLKILVTEQNIIFATREYPYTKADYQQGFRLKTSAILRNPSSPATFLKSLNALDNLMARDEARQQGYHDALFLNFAGHVTEGSTCNIFWSVGGKIYTPSLACGLLDGIIRHEIMARWPVCEGTFTLADLYGADELFITNSVALIMQVSALDDRLYPAAEVSRELGQKLFGHLFELG